MCARSAVIYVAENVKLVDGKTLDNLTGGNDESVSTTSGYDSIDDYVDISRLSSFSMMLIEQLLYDVRKLSWQRLGNLGARCICMKPHAILLPIDIG